LLKIEELSNQAWFTSFEALEDSLTKALVLVALMSDKNIINFKEADQFKKFLLTSQDSAVVRIIKSFIKLKSLFALRSELRGRLGLPRNRASDTTSASAIQTPVKMCRSKSFSPVRKRNSNSGSLSPMYKNFYPKALNQNYCLSPVALSRKQVRLELT